MGDEGYNERNKKMGKGKRKSTAVVVVMGKRMEI